jgi:hypothetical protein
VTAREAADWPPGAYTFEKYPEQIAVRPLRPSERTPIQQPSPADALVLHAIGRLDKTALGVAVGVLGALVVAGATLVLIAKGGPRVGPMLALLAQYFVGYTVTPGGSLVGAGYGFCTGFLLGWIAAAIRNAIVGVYLRVVMFRATLATTQTFMDDL